AAWLGKRLLVVPVANHVEQHLNALDAQKAGLAVAADSFDLTPILRPWKTANLSAYRSWVQRAGSVLLSVIEEVTRPAVRKFVSPHSQKGLQPLTGAPQHFKDLWGSNSRKKYCGKPVPEF